MTDDAPPTAPAAVPTGPAPRPAPGAGTWAFRLGLAAYVLTPLCRAAPPSGDLSPAGREGALFASFVITMLPALLALLAVGLGIGGLRGPAAQRGDARNGLLLGGGYLAVLTLIVLGVLAHRSWTAPPPPRPPARSSAPLTDDEVRAFARTVEERLAAGDATFFDSRFDIDGLVEKAFAGTDVDAATREQARAGFASRGMLFGPAIVQALREGQRYTLLRLRQVGTQRTALFRMLGDGVNYHELDLTRGADGAVAYDDLHAFVGDVRISAMLRGMAAPDAAAAQLTRLTELVQQGRSRDALALHAGLPAALQARKEFMAIRVFAAQDVGGTECDRALDALGDEAFTSDPGLVLVLLEPLLARGRFDRCLKALRQLDAAIGGDPFLAAEQARVELKRGALARARSLARVAASQEPGLVLAQDVLLDVSLAEKDYTTTFAVLARLEAELHVDLTNARAKAGFAAFEASPQGASWARRAGPAPR